MSEQTAGRVPGDGVVGDADVCAAAPQHLPVRGVQQPLPAQDLRAALEPVWVVRGRAVRPRSSGRPVAVGQTQLRVRSVGVKGQVAGN